MATKVKASHRRDFSAYLHWARKHMVIHAPIPPISHGDASALVVFVEYESRGKLRPTRHPRLLRAVLLGKADLNRQIKDWSEGWADCGGQLYWRWARRFELPCVPAWAYEAARNQHYARMLKRLNNERRASS